MHVRPEDPIHSIVVPVYNEAAVIDEFYARAAAVLAELPDGHELIFVDDGSTDRTSDKVEAICARDNACRAVFLSRNFGQQVAVTAGMDAAEGDTVTVIDADLQDPPEVVPELIEEWRRGADVAYAVRTRREGEGLFKVATARVFYRMLNKMTRVDMAVDAGDFRLLDRQVVDALGSMRENARYIRGLVSWVGFEQQPVGYVRQPRAAGETKYPLRKMVRFALDAMVSFSDVPLRMASYMGFAASAVAFLYAIYVLYTALFTNKDVPGWSSLIVAVLFFGGVQLLFMGVIGEYLSRIFEEVKERPLYVVKRRLGFSESPETGLHE